MGTSGACADLDIKQAVQALRDGGVVLHATEGVWGLACDPWCEAAVLKILQIKHRSVDKGLILIAGEAAHFSPQMTPLTDEQRTQIMATWPGPHTWILPDQHYPAWVRGVHRSVACRVPGHAQARALAQTFGAPVISTSANLAGQPSITDEQTAFAQFAHLVDYPLSGQVGERGRASTIHQLDGEVLR